MADEATALLAIEQSFPQVDELVDNIIELVKQTVQDPIKDDDDVLPERSVLTQASSSGTCSVFTALKAAEIFQEIADEEDDLYEARIASSRATYSEALARGLLGTFSKRDRLLEVLTVSAQVGTGGPQNALEVAVTAHLANFVGDPRVQECIQEIWNGSLTFANGTPTLVELGRSRSIPRFVFYDLVGIPKYQFYVENILSIVFLFLYSYVSITRSDAVTVPELVMYVWVLGYLIDEIAEFYLGGSELYFLNVFNLFDIITNLIFVASLVLRLLGKTGVGSAETTKEVSYYAFDILAINAIFLYIKLLNILANYQWIGVILLIFHRMLKDGCAFIGILMLVMFGFAQSLYAISLSPQGLTSSDSYWQILTKLFLSVLGNSDWDSAQKWHTVFGTPLYVVYTVLNIVLLLNILIALFSDSFSKIVEHAQAEHLVMFSARVLLASTHNSSNRFPPPLNLVSIVLYPVAQLLPPHQQRIVYRIGLVVSLIGALPLLLLFEGLRRLYGVATSLTSPGGLRAHRSKYAS